MRTVKQKRVDLLIGAVQAWMAENRGAQPTATLEEVVPQERWNDLRARIERILP